LCFLLSRAKSCPHLSELQFSNLEIYEFDKFIERLLKSNKERKHIKLKKLGFHDVQINLTLENDVIWLKLKLIELLKMYG